MAINNTERTNPSLEMDGEELLSRFNQNTDKYFLVNIIAKRARDLVDGEKPQVDPSGTIRPSEIALRELTNAKLKVTPKAGRNKLVDIVREVSERS
ncbi:MAG TPA: DNA-directed RNA polymerase subunit omega [Candidatus Sumerlaeota bacterium]|nr:MAG: DNA-directed RNA polymerase subunit omega [candidate division BRC1 bacterium ADurb.Bin183]HOE62498.1 DNA-directed RNA polymerase subunit omega [Candidatus Sumerlaeota bacterium]HRR30426.1 DNA-directed RNA polymerase subunit omega [Candidatus Sumerlaeia bacterium]HON50061.1 DNA-directed RNA polymerase subunit omega [Candidatus Sumerlaeota bacterium]HOR63277.1 DNA-directed RNA polymerase subunit omega [Candidatus Sumerlaeota bacterium]